jgi:hypothetical protein
LHGNISDAVENHKEDSYESISERILVYPAFGFHSKRHRILFSEHKSDLMQLQKIRLEKHTFAASAAALKPIE